MQVTKEDAATLMNFLDKDGSGTVDMNEFLVGVRVIISYYFWSILLSNLLNKKGSPNQRR